MYVLRIEVDDALKLAEQSLTGAGAGGQALAGQKRTCVMLADSGHSKGYRHGGATAIRVTSNWQVLAPHRHLDSAVLVLTVSRALPVAAQFCSMVGGATREFRKRFSHVASNDGDNRLGVFRAGFYALLDSELDSGPRYAARLRPISSLAFNGALPACRISLPLARTCEASELGSLEPQRDSRRNYRHQRDALPP